MIPSTFSSVVERIGSIAITSITGEISGSADQLLQQAYREAIKPSTQELLLDLSGVEYINSTGISLLIRLISQAGKESVRINFCGLTEHYTEIFRITRMTDYVGLFPDRQTAVQELSNLHGFEGAQNDQT